VGDEFRARIGAWDALSRWERSELGKDLRRLGLSYGEIMNLIPVKKSTLATWCREVRLTEGQYEAIRERTYGSRIGIPVDTPWKRRHEIELIRTRTRLEVPHLVSDPCWVAGTVLSWAEGAKTRNKLRLANSDPGPLRLFIEWVRTFLDRHALFSIQLHLHEGNDEPAARHYWRTETGLMEANFYRTFIKPRGTGHRKNHPAHGACTVSVRRCSDDWQRVMAWVSILGRELGVYEPSN